MEMAMLSKISLRTITRAAALIMKGGLVAYPTDTVYGLGCDPLNERAVQRLVRAKKRQQGRLPLLVDTFGKAEEIGWFDEVARKLARKFWPGPLTIVVPARTRLPEYITGATDTVGLRIPAREDTIALIRACAGAIVGTSANISGNASPISASDVMRQLGGQVDLILDGGTTRSGTESSVVRVEGGRVSILRSKAIANSRIFSLQYKTGPELSRVLKALC